MKKKFATQALSLLMTAAMAGSMLPASVLAEEETASAAEASAVEETDAAGDASGDAAAEEATDITYTAAADGQVLSGIINDADSTYTYKDWTGASTVVPLETLLLPAGTETVDLIFSENALAYSYDADSNYLAGWYTGDNYMVGADTASVSVDSNKDGTPDYILVQTPYDSSWNSTLLYVITFEYVDFMAETGDTALEDIEEDGTYSYKSWTGAVTEVPLKTVTIPEGTETVDLYFSRNILAYSYDADGNYLAGWYSGDNYMVGADTASVNVDSNNDGTPDYILIQTPYDSSWNSTLLYVITFTYEQGTGSEPDDNDEEIQDMYIASGDAQLNNLNSDPASEKNDASTTDWEVLGLSRAGVEIPQETLDAYYQSIEDRLTENDGVLSSRRYTEYSRTILALTAAGYDPTDVAGYDLTEKLADYDAVSAQGLNGQIYALLALDCNDYTIPETAEGKTQTTREQLMEDILDAQLSDGGWALSGDAADVDVTALAIQALAKYYDSDESVKAALDQAVEKLSEMQNEDGSFNSSDDVKTSESSAQVITALCAIGIDPDSDSRFIKNGKSALDALELFYINGEGFSHLENGSLNSLATNQCYYALAAYHRFINGQSALYDMRDAKADSEINDDPETEDDTKTDKKPDEVKETDTAAENQPQTEENSNAGNEKAADAAVSSSANNAKTAKTAKTGDGNSLGFYLILLLAACTSAGMLYRRKRA